MPSETAKKEAIERSKSTGQPGKADMTSRFVGLIVIPGHQIVKMEVEEKREWSGNQSLSVRAKP